MDKWDSALGKNNSAFGVLGWGRANCDGPYVLTRPQERRRRIWDERGPALSTFQAILSRGTSSAVSCQGCSPSRANKDARPLQGEASKQRTLQGFSGRISQPTRKNNGFGVWNFMCHWSKKGGRHWHTVHEAAWERKKHEHPRGTATSRTTAKTWAVAMTYVSVFSSFGFTVSTYPEGFSKSSGCYGLNTKSKIFLFCRTFLPKGLFEETSSKQDLNHH